MTSLGSFLGMLKPLLWISLALYRCSHVEMTTWYPTFLFTQSGLPDDYDLPGGHLAHAQHTGGIHKMSAE